MSQRLAFPLLSVLCAFFASAPAAAREVQTVPALDLQRYVGRWYEIASIPASFQRACVSDTVAEYRLLPDGLVEVVNSCTKADGTRKRAEARARVNPKYLEPGKLEVTFVKLWAWVWAFSGNYWVMDLGPNYEYAVIGDPSREYGWILARTPELPRETLLAIRERLALQGYDTCALKFKSQKNSGASPESVALAGTPLCELPPVKN